MDGVLGCCVTVYRSHVLAPSGVRLWPAQISQSPIPLHPPPCQCQDACLNRMLFKLKIAEESYNDEKRVKVSVFKMEPMDYVKECQVS